MQPADDPQVPDDPDKADGGPRRILLILVILLALLGCFCGGRYVVQQILAP